MVEICFKTGCVLSQTMMEYGEDLAWNRVCTQQNHYGIWWRLGSKQCVLSRNIWDMVDIWFETRCTKPRHDGIWWRFGLVLLSVFFIL